MQKHVNMTSSIDLPSLYNTNFSDSVMQISFDLPLNLDVNGVILTAISDGKERYERAILQQYNTVLS